MYCDPPQVTIYLLLRHHTHQIQQYLPTIFLSSFDEYMQYKIIIVKKQLRSNLNTVKLAFTLLMYSGSVDGFFSLQVFVCLQACANSEVTAIVSYFTLHSVPEGVSSPVHKTKYCCAHRWKNLFNPFTPEISSLSVCIEC